MQFIDQARIAVRAGRGGDGIVAFRREKYVPAGGPSGGDGGRGGDVLLLADSNLQTLLDFKYRRRFEAEDGRRGGPNRCTGASGSDLVVRVPCGTEVRDRRTGILLGDLVQAGDQLLVAAEGLESHGDLVVVVEHAGWPRNGSDDERELWAAGINALAGLGDNVLCKISGLAMPLRSMAVDVLAPWLEHVIDAFGVDRCLFASNFPVDGIHGTFDELYTAYSAITSGLGDEARDKLFAANAERIYRC
jgi:hypothetical protein